MRPVKQAGVISTHVLDFFAPISTAQGAVLVLLHVSREAFFFVSACMVTYAYMGLNRSGLRQFYWRRFVSVGVPYLCWTVIYYLYTLHASHYATPRQSLTALLSLFEFSYYHLYFLIVIMQFYLVFPLLLIGLRRTRRYHGLINAVVALVQVLLAIAKLVVALTVLAAIAAEVPYYLSQWHVTTVLGSTTDPFQPSVIPFNIGAIACLYLVGTFLVRSGRMPTIVRMGSDNSYGVYLSHMLFIVGLYWLGWEHLTGTIAWPL